jgi:hypothetical protein
MSDDSRPRLPGFRLFCTVAAVLYVLLGASMKLRGAHEAMRPFGVPKAVLDAPHFDDFFQFLFLHMMVIGLLIGLLGWTVQGARRQRAVARVLCGLQLLYATMDFRTSDSPLGNGLYQGKGSLVPPLMGVAMALVFAWLGTRRVAVEAVVPQRSRLRAD